MDLKNFTCPNCGASVPANPNLETVSCNMCGTSFVVDESNVAKHTVNKITGLANRWMDDKKEREIRKAEEKRNREILREIRQREQAKQAAKYMVLYVLLIVLLLLFAKFVLF